MIVSQTQAKNEDELLATPIVSNRSIPKDLTLESDRFFLDSPASALTERSNNSNNSDGGKSQKRTFRFSCPDEKPIIVPRSRIVSQDRNLQNFERGGLSRSNSTRDDGKRRRKDRRRRRPLAPLSLISSITTLINTNDEKKSNDKRNRNEKRLVVGRTSQLILARDILSCWVRDFTIEILHRYNEKTGFFWLLPNSIYNTFFDIRSSKALAPTIGRQLPASHESRIRWNRRKKLRNLSCRKRKEQPICISGLPNQGQTCFLNSVLQSLASLEPFLQYLEGIVNYQEEKEQLCLSSTFSQETTKTLRFGGYDRLFLGYHDTNKDTERIFSSSSFSKELLDLLKRINNVDCGIINQEIDKNQTSNLLRRQRRLPKKKLDPKALLQKIAKSNSQFSSYGMSDQQDAQELFASLMGVVIHDSQLDISSSDHRLEVESCDIQRYSIIMNEGSEQIHTIGRPRGFIFECDENDWPMTSALAHFSKDEKDTAPTTSTLDGYANASSKLLSSNQMNAELEGRDIDEEEDDNKCENNILSLSEILFRIDTEQKRVKAKPNDSNLCLTVSNKRTKILEEKKQEQCDALGDTATERGTGRATTLNNETTGLYRFNGSSRYNERECSKSIFSSGLSQSSASSSSERRRMRSILSPTTPSPLSGWLGSTLWCSKCKHVRPIQNAPFLDIPLVPTSVLNYLSGTYQNSTTKPASPNSSPLPSCSLEDCLEIFTSAENVDDVECMSCTIKAEIERLEEEATMLKGAVESMERRILNRTRNGKANSKNANARGLQSLEETKCLRDDLIKVQARLMELEKEDPDRSCGDKSSQVTNENNEEDFFGTTDPRDKTPMQRCRAKKCLLMTRTPSILCCHIQRRYYDPFNGNMEKCVQFVEFPEFLDLSPYCAYGPSTITPWVAGSGLTASSTLSDRPKPLTQTSDSNFQGQTHRKRGSLPYKLQSVIEHRGNAFGGHYVSYRRDHTGSWFCISDNVVTPVSWRDVQTCQAYMLFYEAL